MKHSRYIPLAIAAFFLFAAGSADASTVGGISLNSGSLTGVLSSFGINSNFDFTSLVSFLLKPFAIYTIGHSLYEVHEAWKNTGYKPREFAHAAIGAGGTGALIGGGATIANAVITNGSGALLH